MERRLAAIFCADVVGYSRLMGRDEAGTRALLRAFAAEHVEPLVARHGGHVFKTMGDGWLVAFASVVAAVECGLAWQAAVKAPLRFRIGVHLGDVMVEEGDLFGDGVNVAARLEALAEPGGICLSEDAWRQVRQKLDLAAEDMGEQQLKNIALPMRVFHVTAAAGEVNAGGEPSAAVRGYRLPKILLAPFRPLGAGSAEAEALAAGVTETLATALVHFEDFELIDPGGGQALVVAHGAREAGRRLGATYVLEGTLQLAMGKARTGVQLIDAVSGNRVWAETLDREAADVFALQDEITALVASTLGEAIGEEQARVIEGLPDEALDAYQRTIRGLKHLHRINPEDLAIARRHFEAALALEPGQYFVTLCLCWVDAAAIGNGWPASRPDALEHCLAVTREVVRRHDRSAQAHRLMGRLASLKGDHAEALAQSERAYRLNPHSSDMMANHGFILARSGRAAEGVPLAERAIAINPYAPTYYRAYLGLAYFLAGRHADGVAVLSAVEGTVGPSRIARAANLAALGRLDEARAEARLVAADPDFNFDRLIAGLQLASSADRERLVEALQAAGLG